MIRRDQLEQLAATVPVPAATNGQSRPTGGAFDLDRWLEVHADRVHVARTSPWTGGTKWVLTPCPWDAGHMNESAYIVRFSNGAIASGCHHNSCAGNDWASLRSLVEGDADAPVAEDEEDDLPEIVVTYRHLRVNSRDALAALEHANVEVERIFQQGGALVRLRRDGHDHAPRVEVLGVDSLRGELDRTANFLRETKNRGEVPTDPPLAVVRDILTRPSHNFPCLRAVVEAPFFTRQGELIVTPGYHRDAGVVLHLHDGLAIPPVPNEPSSTDVERAKELVFREAFADFPFVDQASRAHTAGLLIAPFVRDKIDGPTPLNAIDSPMPGTGKGLLADAIAHIATGRPAEVMTEAKDTDELRKRITALLLRGGPFGQFDNITKRLESGVLAALLTATTWSDRLLGVSKIVTLPIRTVWCATGNNLEFSRENRRRTVWIRMDAKSADPHLRDDFRHPALLDWVREHRGELVWATLLLIQNWISAGQPRFTERRLGSYERWGEVVGGILAAAGIEGFLGNVGEFAARADAETIAWQRFVDAWWQQHNTNPVTVRALFDLAQVVLPEVVGEGNEHAQRTRLGQAMSKHTDWIIGHRKIVAAEVQDAEGRKRAGWALRIAREPVPRLEVGAVGPNPANSRRSSIPNLPAEVGAGWGPETPGKTSTPNLPNLNVSVQPNVANLQMPS